MNPSYWACDLPNFDSAYPTNFITGAYKDSRSWHSPFAWNVFGESSNLVGDNQLLIENYSSIGDSVVRMGFGTNEGVECAIFIVSSANDVEGESSAMDCMIIVDSSFNGEDALSHADAVVSSFLEDENNMLIPSVFRSAAVTTVPLCGNDGNRIQFITITTENVDGVFEGCLGTAMFEDTIPNQSRLSLFNMEVTPPNNFIGSGHILFDWGLVQIFGDL